MTESNDETLLDPTPETLPPPVLSPVEDYILTEDERANYHVDETRVEVRTRVSRDLPSTHTVYIKDSDGQIWDSVSGALEVEAFLEALSPEERQARLEEEATLLAEAERAEKVIKPLVMKRLKADARSEFREYVKAQANEILRLRAEIGRLQQADNNQVNSLKGQLAATKAEVIQLKRKLAEEAAKKESSQ